MKKELHISLDEMHPAYQWAKKQSDSVNALGHIGTHIDCYSKEPICSVYEVGTVVVDCRKAMPSVDELELLNCNGKLVVLYTSILRTCGYGNKEYGDSDSFLNEESLDALLAQNPKFIAIDACGIGSHGEEHIRFDKKCEANNCFVIENVFLDDDIISSLKRVKIEIDIDCQSTGKPCKIYI